VRAETGGDQSSRVARVVAVANQKGGVGKTTTAVNLGASLAEAGQDVIVVDLDPQGNASTGLGVEPARRSPTSYDVITGRVDALAALQETPIARLRALPATVDLAGAEVELVGQFARESMLKRALEPLRREAAVVLLDCPPSLGLLTVNALCAADEVLIPIQCEYFALEGLGQLLKNLRLVQQNINPRLRLNGIVLTMYDARTKLAEQVVGEIRAYFGSSVYATVIPRSVRLSEAPGYGAPITAYDSASTGAKAYRSLAQEFLQREPPDEPIGSQAAQEGFVAPSVGDGSRSAIRPAAADAGTGSVAAPPEPPARDALGARDEDIPEARSAASSVEVRVTTPYGTPETADIMPTISRTTTIVTPPRRSWWPFGRSKGGSG
jgi:chromosome partitioning protein